MRQSLKVLPLLDWFRPVLTTSDTKQNEFSHLDSYHNSLILVTDGYLVT